MKQSEQQVELEREVERLRAILNIRDHVMQTTVNTIYESTGQLLSLIRIKLAMLEISVPVQLQPELNSTSELAGQVIKELRAMSSTLYPETMITEDTSIEELIHSVFPIQVDTPDATETPLIDSRIKFVLLSILWDTRDQLLYQNLELSKITTRYAHNQFSVQLSFLSPPTLSRVVLDDFERRLRTVGGKIEENLSLNISIPIS